MTEALSHVTFTDPISRQPEFEANINGCQHPVGLNEFVTRAIDTIRETIAEATTQRYRKIMIVLCRCARGGKTTALNAIAERLHTLNTNCLVVTFSRLSFSRRPGESDSEALFRVISNELNPSLDKNKRRLCDWEALDAHIGSEPFVLLMDGIKALCGNIIRTELSNILKKYFLDKPNRHLVLTSYFPIYLDENNGTPIDCWGHSNISRRSICLLKMPESFSTEELKKMSPPRTDGITSGFATFYGGVPSLIYTVVTQIAESPAVRFSRRLILGSSTDRNEYASFVEALITGHPDPCLSKYMKFCSSVVSNRLLGNQAKWPPCYAQCILRHFAIPDALVLAKAMISLEAISDVNGDGKLWEQMTKVAILQHLNFAMYKGGYGPFGICENLDVSSGDIEMQGLGEGVRTVEQAIDVIATYASHCRTLTMVVFYPNEATFTHFDGFILVTLGLGNVERLAGYQCKDSKEGAHGVVPESLNCGGHLLRSVAPSTVRENNRGWTYYNDEETDLFLGLSLSVMRSES